MLERQKKERLIGGDKSMEIKIGIGIEDIFFGMSKDEIKVILGEPDKIIRGAVEDWITYEYFDKMIRLIFSKEQNDKLITIEVHHQDILIFGENIFNKSKEEIRLFMNNHGYNVMEYEDYGTFETLASNKLHLTLEFEFNKLNSIEFSPLFKNDDDIIWPSRG